MMTTVGRGRGNWGVKDSRTPLRRPGESSRSSSEEENSILLEIGRLNLSDKHKLDSLEEQMRSYCDNRDHLWRLTQKLYDCSLEDREAGEKVLKLWKNMSKFEVDEVKLRSVIVTAAQKEFEEREEIRKSNPERFMNAVALFGGVFHYMTLPDGEPFKVLIGPLLEYLQLILTECSKDKSHKEAELELLAAQLIMNGNLLKKYAEKELAQFMLQLRSALVGSYPSEKCVYWLLLILDLSNCGWHHQGFPPHLKTFYTEKLGKDYQKLGAINTSFFKEEPQKNTRDQAEDDAVSFRKQDRVSFSDNTSNFKRESYDNSNRKSWQDGNAEERERRKPSYWGHDDRFDRQGDSYSGGDRRQSERPGKRGGQGGRGSWRGRGDGRSKMDNRDSTKWNDEAQNESHSQTSGGLYQGEEEW